MSKVAKYLLFSSLMNITEMLSVDPTYRVHSLPRSKYDIEAALFPLRIHLTLAVFFSINFWNLMTTIKPFLGSKIHIYIYLQQYVISLNMYKCFWIILYAWFFYCLSPLLIFNNLPFYILVLYFSFYYLCFLSCIL